MIICDLCGNPKDCAPRQIEGREYDICSACWTPIENKLKGKGRVKPGGETVLLPAPTQTTDPPEQDPAPGQPPKIWALAHGSSSPWAR